MNDAASHRNTGTMVAAALLLAALSLYAAPLRFDHGNSGRYLLQVLQAADPELFPGDPVVDSLVRFRSLFYDALAWGFAVSRASPESLESTLESLYALSRIATLLLAMALARAMGGGAAAALLFGTWCCFKKSPPVGGDSLFVNVMHHGTVAFLVAVTAMLAVFLGRPTRGWALLGLALWIHPLMTLHLALCIVPAWLLVDRPSRAERLAGAGLLATSLAVYLAWMAPPALSADEAAIFLEAKREISHVSLKAQSPLAWLSEGLVLTLAWLVAAGRECSRPERMVAVALASGVVMSLGLSLCVELVPHARLVQLQPLRTFLWLHFLAYGLLVLAAARELHRRSWRGVLLLAVVVFSMIPTLWQLPILAIAVLHLAGERLAPHRMSRVGERTTMMSLGTVVAAMAAGWLLRERVGDFETLLNPWPPLLGICLLLWSAIQLGGRRRSAGFAAALVVCSLAGSGIYWHRFYDRHTYPQWGTIFKDRAHVEWSEVRRWIAAETPKEARFLVAGGHENFRTRALRSAVGEPMSALAWVAPEVYLEVAREARDVARAHRSGVWDLEELTRLGRAWNARYLLVNGATSPSFTRPEIQLGPFRVYDIRRFD